MYRTVVNGTMSIQEGSRQPPGFLVIGAQKAATTTLTAALRSNPQLRSAFFKEVHYFDLYFDSGPGWYQRHFPIARDEGVITFETTPYYLFHPLVPARVHQFNREMKLVVILRDPVERAYSHYQMERKRGNEPIISFAEAVELEEGRISADLQRLADGTLTKSSAVQRYSYLSRGYYEEQLKRWLALFPRAQMHIIDLLEFQQHPAAVLSKMADFLHVEDNFKVPSRRLMTGHYATMDKALSAQLRWHFRERNANLETMVGMKFDWLR